MLKAGTLVRGVKKAMAVLMASLMIGRAMDQTELVHIREVAWEKLPRTLAKAVQEMELLPLLESLEVLGSVGFTERDTQQHITERPAHV